MAKEILIVANWKMNKTQEEIGQWLKEFAANLGQIKGERLAGIKSKTSHLPPITIFLTPPLPYLNFISLVIGHLHLSSIIELAGQNVSQFEKGSYTGEISAFQLKDLECLAVIVGHSERRRYFHETDRDIAKKTLLSLKYGLLPIVCVSKMEEVESLKKLILRTPPLSRIESPPSQKQPSVQTPPLPISNPSPTVIFSKIAIVYEPLFAIGSGKPDTPEDAQKMALEIKKILGEDTKVLYGGSADSKNAANFLKQPDIEGLLVGTASLDPKKFSAIIEKAASVS